VIRNFRKRKQEEKARENESWDDEYRNPTFLSLGTEPSADIMRFYKGLKKEWRIEEIETGNPRKDAESLRVIDLGCGTGKNAVYFMERGAYAVGLDISSEAIAQAMRLAQDKGVPDNFQVADLSKPLPFDDRQFNIALDMTTSHCLAPDARKQFIKETARVLEKGGQLFGRILCLDGDANAKQLLEKFPGPEGSYILPETKLPEWPLSKEKLMELYSPYFEIVMLERTWHYAPFGGKKFKRAYWLLKGKRK
jgi:ubiquinone/menaquinone biosynthesis C-methylase UbiE